MKKFFFMVCCGALAVAGLLGGNVYAGLGGDVCAGAGLGENCNGSIGNPGNTVSNLIGQVVQIIFSIVGILAVLMMILGGINLMTSAGDPGKIKKGKDTIIWGIIGLCVTLFSYVIINFVLTAIINAQANS